MTKTSITLCDDDLATLVSSADTAVRTAAEAARDRLAAPSRWPTVASHVAALIADVIAEAKKEGRLIYRGVSVSRCGYCGARSEWKKPPRKRREREYPVAGVDFADRFVVISRHITVGACRSCVEQALPVLRQELMRFPVQLPTALRSEGAPVYQRWDRCRCKKCEWSGHDGQLGKLRTLMGDGYYPGKCPRCAAERRPLGPDPFERLDGFDVVAEGSP
jgi:bacterioferritin-associated ferredoxin